MEILVGLPSDHHGRKESPVEHGGDNKPVREHVEHIVIFVNKLRFMDPKVKPIMSVAEIAGLVGIPAECAVVRRLQGNKPGDPLSGNVELKNGDHFSATRKKVDGGKGGDRVDGELRRIEEGGGQVQRLAAPDNAVVYRELPILGRPEMGTVDVLVHIPGGYPAQMLDHAALPSDSPLIGKVKGAPQEVFNCGGRQWRKISYHPHGNGGAGPWNPQIHGFDTYLGEVLSWLADLQ